MESKIKILLGALIAGFVLWNNSALAELPIEVIKERNSKAEEILVGTVWGIYNAPKDWIYPHKNTDRLKYFNLRIKEVQKTTSGLKVGDIIKIVFVQYGTEAGIAIGTTPVKIKLFQKIKIYADPTNLGNNIFEPVIDGLSIENYRFCSRKILEDCNGERVKIIGVLQTPGKGYSLCNIKNRIVKYPWGCGILVSGNLSAKDLGKKFEIIGIINAGGELAEEKSQIAGRIHPTTIIAESIRGFQKKIR